MNATKVVDMIAAGVIAGIVGHHICAYFDLSGFSKSFVKGGLIGGALVFVARRWREEDRRER